MDGGVRREEVAYRPIAAEHRLFRAELVPEEVQNREVKCRVFRQTPIRLPGNIGNFGINIRQFGYLLKCMADFFGFCAPIPEWQVINDHAQVWRELRKARQMGENRCAANDIQAQPTFGEGFEILFEGALAKTFCQHLLIKSQAAE